MTTHPIVFLRLGSSVGLDTTTALASTPAVLLTWSRRRTDGVAERCCHSSHVVLTGIHDGERSEEGRNVLMGLV